MGNGADILAPRGDCEVRSPDGDPTPLVGAKQRHACDGVAKPWGPIVAAPRRQLREPQIGCGWGPHVGANLVL